MEARVHASRVRIEHLVLALLAALALGIRLYYVRTAIVDHPLRGDAVQYFSYAWNLLHSHVFSMARPDADLVVPDSFRDPGYPFFLAVVACIKGTGEAFYTTVLDVQCLLSALTVWMYAILARRWTGFGAAVATGFLLALWPHVITLSGYVLSETLLGFLVASALLLTDSAMRGGRLIRPALAGFAFALAALTNAVVLPFAPLLGLWMAWRDRTRRSIWLVLVVCAILPAAAWGWRAATLPPGQSSGDRAIMNLVQGAWPEYHPSYRKSLQGDAAATAAMMAVDAEYQAMRDDHVAGMHALLARLGEDPWRYTRWYLSKPVELWGWEIGIGQGDIYVFPTTNSPLTGTGVLRTTTDICFLLSPLLLLLALAGTVMTLLPASEASVGLRTAALLGVFVTAIYAVLQSDARYSIPFRGIEMALASYAVARIITTLRRVKVRHSEEISGRSTS